MAHYPKKTIFSQNPGFESPKLEHSIFSQSPSLPRPHSTLFTPMLTSPLLEGIPRVSSSKVIACSSSFIPRGVTMNREALETLTETSKPRNSPFFRLDLLEKKNLLLEEENRKLLEINDIFGGENEKRGFEEKIKSFERKVEEMNEENKGLIKEIKVKALEINKLEKLLKVHQEEYNVRIMGVNKEKEELKEMNLKIREIEIGERRALMQQIEEKDQQIQQIEENNKQLQQKEEKNKQIHQRFEEILKEQKGKTDEWKEKVREISANYDDQVKRNEELDIYYSETMMQYKVEITSIRSQYDEKIQNLTVSKDKFEEYATATHREIEHLRKNIKEKSEEIVKLNQLVAKASLQNASDEYFNQPAKRLFINNIEDFGEKIANLLQENEKLNERSTINELEAAQWRAKYQVIEEKLKEIHNRNKNYLNSEPDFNDEEATLREKNVNSIRKPPKTDPKKRVLNNNTNINYEGKRPSYKMNTKNVTNGTLRSSTTKENIENHYWPNQVKITRNVSGTIGGVKQCKIERNLSYSIRKNY